MKSERFNEDYLNDILNAIDAIKIYTRNMTYEQFIQNGMCAHAVLLNIAIIGESAGKISKEIQQKYSEIPFPSIISMRNKLIHDYFEVDLHQVWLVIQNDLPLLKKQMKVILKNL